MFIKWLVHLIKPVLRINVAFILKITFRSGWKVEPDFFQYLFSSERETKISLSKNGLHFKWRFISVPGTTIHCHSGHGTDKYPTHLTIWHELTNLDGVWERSSFANYAIKLSQRLSEWIVHLKKLKEFINLHPSMERSTQWCEL